MAKGYLLDGDSIRSLRTLNLSDNLEDKARRSRPQMPSLNIPFARWGKLTEALVQFGSAEMDVWDLDDSDGTPYDADDAQRVWDIGLISIDDSLAIGTTVAAIRMGNHFVVIAAPCSTSASESQHGIPEADITTDTWEVG